MARDSLKVVFPTLPFHAHCWISGFVPYAALRQCQPRKEQLTMANGDSTPASGRLLADPVVLPFLRERAWNLHLTRGRQTRLLSKWSGTPIANALALLLR